MAGKSERFTAYVYENDYTEIQKLVQQYPNIETGGDLFGLWKDDKSVVIQLFIGPGKESKRTTTSFHQDVAYLQKVGTVITKEEGLCNVGEWHSHHQIGMPKPSGADKRTVLSNMPQLGLDRFVLFIASIENSDKKKRSHSIQLNDIKLRCFMFREDLRHEDQPIPVEIVKMKENNPVHLKYKAQDVIKEGAEEPPPTEEALEKKRKESEKQESFGSKPPARNQSGPGDENRSPNSDWKEKTSYQRKTDVPQQTTQPAFSSYPFSHSQPRPNQDQGPPRQDQYSSNQGQHRPNQGQGPPRQDQYSSNQGQHRPNQGQGPPRQDQYSSNQGQHRPNQGQGTPREGQFYPSQVQSPSNQGQGPPRQGQGPPRQDQYSSNQAGDSFSQSQATPYPDPTAPNEVRMHKKGFF